MGNQLALIKAVADGDTQASWLTGGDYNICMHTKNTVVVVVLFSVCLLLL